MLVVGVFGPLMGMALYQFLMKGLRDVEEVTKVVVTVSVLLGMVSLSTWIWEPAEPRKVELLFGNPNSVDVVGTTLQVRRDLRGRRRGRSLRVGLRLLFTRTPAGCGDARRRRRPRPASPQRLQPPADREDQLGVRLRRSPMFAGVGGHADHRWLARGHDADPAHHRHLRRGHVRPARSIPRTFVGAWCSGWRRPTFRVRADPLRLGSNVRGALPLIVLFVVLLLIPQDRLRGVAQQRSRERPRVASCGRRWSGRSASSDSCTCSSRIATR